MLKSERGTVLLMFPTAVFIMIVLGALVIDVGLTQVRAKELTAVTASAANDALAALDINNLRDTSIISFDVRQATAIVSESVAAGPLPESVVVKVRVIDPGGVEPQLEVTLRLKVELIMAPALPGDLDSTTIIRTQTVSILG